MASREIIVRHRKWVGESKDCDSIQKVKSGVESLRIKWYRTQLSGCESVKESQFVTLH